MFVDTIKRDLNMINRFEHADLAGAVAGRFHTNELELVGENFLHDVAFNIADGLKASLEFVHHAVTFSMDEFFDSRMRTDIYRNIRSMNADIGRYKKIKYLDVSDKELVVTPGFIQDLPKIISPLINMQTVIDECNDMFSEFDNHISIFITRPEKRETVMSDMNVYKIMDSKLLKYEKDLTTNLTKGRESKTTVGRLYRNINEFVGSISTLYGVYSTIDESDLKKHVKMMTKLGEKLSAVNDIIESDKGSITMAARNNMIASMTTAANAYTIMSKYYYVLFETSQIVAKVKRTIEP